MYSASALNIPGRTFVIGPKTGFGVASGTMAQLEGGASTVCAGFVFGDWPIARFAATSVLASVTAHPLRIDTSANLRRTCRFQKTVIKVAIWTNYDGWTAFGDGIENATSIGLSGYSVFFHENPKTFHAKNVCIDLTFIDIRQQVTCCHALSQMRRNVSAKEFPHEAMCDMLGDLASALFTSGVCQAGPISISVGQLHGRRSIRWDAFLFRFI